MSTIIALLSGKFQITGVERLVKNVLKKCVTCKKQNARTAKQLMGQLPSNRIRTSSPFYHTGVDFAGPLLLKRGNPRKPTLVKAYLAIFICFATKATHVALVSDLTTDAFLATLKRFVARRECPSVIISDNATNFLGAKNHLDELQRKLKDPQTADAITNFLQKQRVEWKTIPSRAPHFGGLWETTVKSFKNLLRKVVGENKLTWKEMAIFAAEIEAALNSWPLTPLESTAEDGTEALTPGHFLIGRPLLSLPTDDKKLENITTLRRWNLLQHLTTEFWRRWRTEYLVNLNRLTKWKCSQGPIQQGDVVILKDEMFPNRSWPLARVQDVHPGPDGLPRVVT